MGESIKLEFREASSVERDAQTKPTAVDGLRKQTQDETALAEFTRLPAKDLYEDPKRFRSYTAVLVRLKREDDLRKVFSKSNPLLARYLNSDLVLSTLGALHRQRSFVLLHDVCEIITLLDPGLLEDHRIVQYYSRACNGVRKYEKALEMLTISVAGALQLRFPNEECTKNLVYALNALGRTEEAAYFVEMNGDSTVFANAARAVEKRIRSDSKAGRR